MRDLRRPAAPTPLGYNFPFSHKAARVALESTVSYYRSHVFFCCNQREGGEKCCADAGAFEMQKYAKGRIKALGLSGRDNVRINKAGCLDRCEEGPVLVVYPDAVWYTYVDREDIDEIIDRHVVGGEIVARLQI